MRVLLLIGGVWNVATTDSSTDPDINIIWDNLANPSITTDNYTFNLLLPRCDDNDKLFSHFCLLDSVITGGGYDPTHAMHVKCISDEGNLLINGRAIIEDISSEHYSLSISGKLADIWTSLLNSGWDATRDDEGYTLLNDEFEAKLNAELVANSFAVNPSLIPFNLSGVTGHGEELASEYGITDANNAVAISLVGFAPTAQGKPRGIDTTQWLTKTEVDGALGDMPQITSIFCTKKDVEGNELNGRTGTSCVEAQMAQYRSYNQQPYVYVAKLWQLFARHCSAICGYDMQLDDEWFNESNHLLKDVIFTLPQMYDGTDAKYLNTISSSSPRASQSMRTGSDINAIIDVATPADLAFSSYITNNITISDHQYQKINSSLNINLVVGAVGSSMQTFGLSNLRSDKVSMYVNVKVGNDVIKRMALLVIPDDSRYPEEYHKMLALNDTAWPTLYQLGYRLVIVRSHGANRSGGSIALDRINFTLSTFKSGQIRVDVGFVNYGRVSPFVVSVLPEGRDYVAHTGVGSCVISMTSSSRCDSMVYECNRTNKKVNLGTILGGISPFSILTRYSKIMRLYWSIDEENKIIRVRRMRDHLEECFLDITDISKYVDGGRDWSIKPLSWSSHNVILNYQPSPMVDYESRYGITYGSKKIVTSNELNDNTELLLCRSDLDNISSPILATETLLTRYSVEVENAPQNTVTNEPMIMNHTNGDSADTWGAFFIRKSNGNWNALLGYRDGVSLTIDAIVAVTDDTDIELDENKFTYHNIRYRDDIGVDTMLQRVGTMPVFDICDDSRTLAIQLAPTREVYTNIIYPSSMRYLYDNVWAGYIGELYNAQNKTLIVNAYLTNDILYKMRTNPIVKIDNILYMVCKVEGWKASTRYARLTLRQIFDKSNFSA